MSSIRWTFAIEGMTCDHCATTIDAALRKIPGVLDASTDYASGTSTVVADANVTSEALVSAIRAKRYRVVSQDSRPVASTHEAAAGDLDLLILGGGSAGFAAAIRAADLGAKVAIVEAGALGGTCVNIGCVPSKTMIRAAEVAHRAAHHAFDGIRTHAEVARLDAIVAQKDALVAELQQSKYWDVLAAYPDVMLIRGRATLRSDGTALVDGKEIRARKIMLSLGASPWAPPIPGLDRVPFLTSTEAFALRELPARLAVVGGSAVGLELAQLFARLGSKVTVIEAMPRLVPTEDADASAELTRHLADEGLDIITGAAIRGVSGQPGSIAIDVEAGGARRTIQADQLLVATGRRPNTKGMGLEEAGITLGPKGEIVVDRYLETTRPGVYAAGDAIGDPAFVYVAAYAGSLAAENALQGNARAYDPAVVPRVTFTDPALASVGLTEAQARERGIDIAVSMLPMAYVPRAIAARDTRGLIKLVADKRTNLLVGAHVVAPEAGEMIQEPTLAIRHGIRVDELAAMLHPYLTNAEGIKLACQTFSKDVAKLSCCAA